jgi:hypothetical protein
MRVGILGSGLMGGKLGTIFARAKDTAAELIRDAGFVVRGNRGPGDGVPV